MDSDERELRLIEEALTRLFSQMAGPLSDMTRALMAAQVDGLIDARKRLLAAGWEEWQVAEAIGFLVGSAKDSMKKLGEGLGNKK